MAGTSGVISLARRFALGLAGEGLQSGFHFAVNLVLIRRLPAYDYGLFAIVFTLGSLALTYSNALVATPAAVHIPRLRSRGAAAFQDVVFGSMAAVLAVVTAGLVLGGVWLWERSMAVACAACLFVAAWSARNYVRTSLFAHRLPGRAALSDLCFACVGAFCLVALPTPQAGSGSLADVLYVLALANAAGIAAALAARGWKPKVSLRRSVWRRYRSHWGQVSWSLAGVTTANVQAQFQTFLVAALAGPAAYAPIAAALVIVAPMRLAMSALIYMLQPEFAAALAGNDLARARTLLVNSSALVVGGCLVYGGLIWAGFGLVDRFVFGASFGGEPMLLITVLAWATALVYLSYTLPKALMEAAGEFKSVAAATLASVAVGVVAVALLLALAGPAWSLAGVIAAELVTLAHFARKAARIVAARSTDRIDVAPAPSFPSSRESA